MAIPSQQNYNRCESGPVALSQRDGHCVPVCIYRSEYFTLLYSFTNNLKNLSFLFEICDLFHFFLKSFILKNMSYVMSLPFDFDYKAVIRQSLY